MKLAPITTKEERYLWDDMKRELHQHSNYHVKKQYYPFKMDVWETERKSIEDHYRSKICELQKEIKVRRLQEEDAANARKRQEEEERKLRKERKQKEKKETVVVLRRSNRLISKVAAAD